MFQRFVYYLNLKSKWLRFRLCPLLCPLEAFVVDSDGTTDSSSTLKFSRTIVFLLPLFLLVHPEVANGDKGKKICGKETVVGGEIGLGENRGDKESVVVGRAKKRSSISIECDLSICSSIDEIGFVFVDIAAFVVSFIDFGLIG